MTAATHWQCRDRNLDLGAPVLQVVACAHGWGRQLASLAHQNNTRVDRSGQRGRYDEAASLHPGDQIRLDAANASFTGSYKNGVITVSLDAYDPAETKKTYAFRYTP